MIAPTSWKHARVWRRAKRDELIRTRLSTPRAERARIASVVGTLVDRALPELARGCVGVYWPL